MESLFIIDDDQEILRTLSQDLDGLGDLRCFESPKDALKAMEKTAPRVVLSDFAMNEMNGLEVLRNVRNLFPNCVRGLLTGGMDLSILPDMINEAHINFLVKKPWEKNNLRDIIREAIITSRLADENEALRKLVLNDALTEIANRRYFDERIRAEATRAKRYQRPLSLLLGDIDDFKKINDSKGHIEGDRILKSVAKALVLGRRTMDLVARYGGEEFAILLPEAKTSDAVEIAKRIQKQVDEQTGIHMSFGVASIPEQAQTDSQLLAAADFALLDAKKRGKFCVVAAEGV